MKRKKKKTENKILDAGYWILDGKDLSPPIKGGLRGVLD